MIIFSAFPGLQYLLRLFKGLLNKCFLSFLFTIVFQVMSDISFFLFFFLKIYVIFVNSRLEGLYITDYKFWIETSVSQYSLIMFLHCFDFFFKCKWMINFCPLLRLHFSFQGPAEISGRIRVDPKISILN